MSFWRGNRKRGAEKGVNGETLEDTRAAIEAVHEVDRIAAQAVGVTQGQQQSLTLIQADAEELRPLWKRQIRV